MVLSVLDLFYVSFLSKVCTHRNQYQYQDQQKNKIKFNVQWPILSFTVAMGKMTAKYRFRLSAKIDSRIRVMNEIIQGIQIIKVYAWERYFAKMVDAMRK